MLVMENSCRLRANKVGCLEQVHWLIITDFLQRTHSKIVGITFEVKLKWIWSNIRVTILNQVMVKRKSTLNHWLLVTETF